MSTRLSRQSVAHLFTEFLQHRKHYKMVGVVNSLQVNYLEATSQELGELLSSGKRSSVNLVSSSLKRIAKDKIDGIGIRAIIETEDASHLLEYARRLDDERKHGKVRGPLHGLPIVIKASADFSCSKVHGFRWL